MTDKAPLINKERATEIYHELLHRAHDLVDKAEDKAKPLLHEAVEEAREQLAKLDKFTDIELNHVRDYLIRDLHSAGEYIAEGERELADWLRLDALYLEDRLKDTWYNMVDHTALTLDALRERVQDVGEWHTGEISGPGTLVCKSCGQEIHFNAAGHIPPCPKCHHATYKRPD